MMRWLFTLMACAFGVSAAFAQEPTQDLDEARYRFRQGVVAYESGHFSDAVEHFEAAHALSGRDEMYYNLFLAHRDNANLSGAVEALEAYLESGAASAMAPQRERLDGVLAAMRDRLQEQAEARAPTDDTQASNEGAAADDSPDPPEVEPQPDVPPQEAAAPRSRTALAVAIASFGVAAGGLALGIAMQVKRGNEADRLDENCRFGPSQDLCRADFDQESLADRHARFGRIRWVGYGLAIAGVAGGVSALLLGRRRSDDVNVQAGCDGTGCTAALRGRF